MSRSILPDTHATRETLFLRLKPDTPGCEMAWREFHDRYAPIIGGFARRMGAKDQDVFDLVQDVLLGFFSVSPQFAYDPAKGRFRGYLKTCTWRVFQTRLNKHLRLNGRCLADVDPEDCGVEQAWNDVWETEKLQRAVDRVRDDYQSSPDRARTFQAFELYVLLERPAEDVATELGLTVNGVHQAKSRVSKALRAAMEETDD